MNRNLIHIVLLFWCSLLWAKPNHSTMANDLELSREFVVMSKDSIIAKKLDTTNNRQPTTSNYSPMARWKKEKAVKTAVPSIIANKKFKSFPELDSYTKNLYLPPSDGKAEFTKDYVKSLFKVDNKTQELLDASKETFGIIEQNQSFINIIGGQEAIELPVGIKQNISENSYITLGVISMEYFPNYTVVDLFDKVKLGELGAELFFGANGVKISKEGGIFDEARLNLLADFPIGQNGGQWLITFKGGLNERGGGDGQTYITINCEGKVKEIAFNADVRIAKTVAVPLNEDGSYKYPGKLEPSTGENPIDNDSYVGANFSLKTAGLDDLLLELNLPYCEFKAFPDLGFKLEETVLDLSDTKNAEGITFPDIYHSQGLLQGNENLWRGFYAKEVKITLPPEFKKKGSKKRIHIAANDLYIDNFGVSGDFKATNILGINEGDASKWQFSVDSIGVDIKVNRFIKGGFNGEIVLPISDEKSTGAKLAYKGLITADKHYSVNVEAVDDVSFDVFKAKAKIFKGSYVKLEVENKRFYPEANLTGLLSFNAKQDKEFNQFSSDDLNESTNVEDLEFDGLSFQNFKIQTRERPYLQIEYAGFKDDIKLPKLGGFELGFYDVSIKSDENDNAVLALNSFVNLDKSGIHGDVRLSVTGELSEGDYLKWKYKGVEVSDIEVDVKRKSFEFSGRLSFFRDNPVYGKGFAGKLDLISEDLGIEVGARGLFGAVDGYRYWFVDANGRPTKNNNKNFNIFDIGGGVYHHMRKAGMNKKATSYSGIYYEPDKRTELGFKALAAFEVKNGGTFTAMAGVEMSFNSKSAGGGLSRLGFYGGAMLIQGKNEGENPQYPFGSLDEMQQKVAAKEQSLSNFHELSIDREGLKYFANEVFPTLLTGEELFAAQVAIDFDFTNKSYWGLLDVYLNAPGGIRGGGPKNLLGRLEYYNAPDEWWIYVGNPTKKFALADIPIGPTKASLGFYFMSGTTLEAPAQPPANVIRILRLKGEELEFGRNFDQELARGVGFAFGGNLSLGMGFDWGIVYANIKAGAGFDLMVRDFGNTQCKGREGPIGMDGWYSMGQLYAFLEGEIGARVNLFGIKKKFPIASAGIALLAQAQLPNPWYAKGYAGVDIRVLGVINIHARLKVVIGEKCEMIGKTGLQEVVMISDITPRDGLTDVDVFNVIQVAFNAPINSEIDFEDDKGIKKYRIKLKDISVTNQGKAIKGEYKFNAQKNLLIYDSHEILPPEQKINVLVRVSFDEKINGLWRPVVDQGKAVIEEKEVSFTTGTAPRKIPDKNIAYMYPIKNQKYMLPKESTSGYIQLDNGQEYLFGNGYSDELYFIHENDTKTKVDFTYNAAQKRLNFTIPPLNNETTYTYALITLNPSDIEEDEVLTAVEFNKISEDLEISNTTIVGNATSSAFISRLNFSFSTSKYNTYLKKMKSIKIRKPITDLENYPDTDNSIANVGRISLLTTDNEPFGPNDVLGTNFTGNQPLIRPKAVMNDRYYKELIQPLIYREYPLGKKYLNPAITLKNRDSDDLGWPPVRSIKVSNTYQNYVLDQPDSPLLKNRFPYRWQLPISYYNDYKDLEYQIWDNFYKNGIKQTGFNEYNYIINGRFPFMLRESYQVDFKYILPGKSSGNSFIMNYKNTF